jgi:hypothetical protein
MAAIGTLVSFSAGQKLVSADMNSNFAAVRNAFNGSAVMSDTATTITVTHSWTVSQQFNGGITVATGQSIIASGVSITGNPIFTQGLAITSGQAVAATGASMTMLSLTVTGTAAMSALVVTANATIAGVASSQVGGSTAVARMPVVLYQTSGLSTTSTGEVSIASYSLPASALATNANAVRISFGWSYTIGASLGYAFKVKFGATQMNSNFGAIANTSPETGMATIVVARTGPTSQLATLHGGQVNGATTTALRCIRTTPGETLSGAVLIDFRGNVTNALDALLLDWVLIEAVCV